ncbi:MAG: hypothetical protein QOJ34_736, partial [Pseudonocardiales bacterium]|nr:hypothetical protein [Pseudonocardiales bacterium]
MDEGEDVPEQPQREGALFGVAPAELGEDRRELGEFGIAFPGPRRRGERLGKAGVAAGR